VLPANCKNAIDPKLGWDIFNQAKVLEVCTAGGKNTPDDLLFFIRQL
jgi:hypothetical protein